MPFLAHVALIVRDYDEAITFYVGKLGFELIEDTYIPEQDKRCAGSRSDHQARLAKQPRSFWHAPQVNTKQNTLAIKLVVAYFCFSRRTIFNVISQLSLRRASIGCEGQQSTSTVWLQFSATFMATCGIWYSATKPSCSRHKGPLVAMNVPLDGGA